MLGEQLDEDLAQDRLVVRERAVEVEDDRASSPDLRLPHDPCAVAAEDVARALDGRPPAENAVRSTSITGAPAFDPERCGLVFPRERRLESSIARTGTSS